jgi:hypothetical protein
LNFLQLGEKLLRGSERWRGKKIFYVPLRIFGKGEKFRGKTGAGKGFSN